MEINNELRRTKQKLKILEETPNIGWVLNDVMDDILDEMIRLNYMAFFDRKKSKVVSDLRLKYIAYIQENSPKENGQSKIEF